VSGFTRFGISADVNSSVVLHKIDARFDPETYLGSVRVQNSQREYVESGSRQIEIPSSISAELASDVTTKKKVLYTVSMIQSSGSGSSWFWRAPLLHGQAIDLDSITTSVFEMLTMLSYQQMWDGTLSRESWEGLYAAALASCRDCSKKPVPEVAEKLAASTDFLGKLASVIGAPSLNAQNFAGTPIRAVHWFPGNLAAQATEGDTIQVLGYFWSLSAAAPLPVKWTFDGAVQTQTGPGYTWSIPLTASGPHALLVEKDTGSTILTKQFTIDVANLNQDPVWTIAPISQRANSVLEVDLASLVNDPDADTLTFTLGSAPAGVVLDGSLLALTPTNLEVGTHAIYVMAADPSGKQIPTSIPYTVTADQLPVFGAGMPVAWNVTEGSASTLTLSAVDADGDAFVMECVLGCPQPFASPVPAGANDLVTTALSATNYRFAWTPDYQHLVGTASQSSTMRFKTKYTGLGMNPSIGTSWDVSVTVTNVDDPPTWIVVPNFSSADENTAFSYTLRATDPSPRPSTLTYACTGRPGWMSLNSSTGVLSGTPSWVDATTDDLTIDCSASDAYGLKVTASNTFKVWDTNRPPSVSAPLPNPIMDGGINLREGVPFSINFSSYFTDPDLVSGDPNEQLRYSCSGCPSGMIINSSTGVVTWTPNYNQAGTYTGLLFSVTDKGGDSFTHSALSVTVDQREGPPVLAVADSITVAEGSSAVLALDVNHNSGDSYGYTTSYVCTPSCPSGMVNLPSATGVVDDPPKSFNITPDYDAGNDTFPLTNKTYSIAFTVIKTGTPALSTTKTVSVRIDNTNRLPTDILFGSSSGSLSGTGGSTYTVSNDGFVPITNRVYLGAVDADGTNDSYTYSATFGAIVGSGANLRWEFNPNTASCWPGAELASVTATITLRDGRGGVVTRDVLVNVTRTSPRGAPCPY
jgi:hypothetical protein